MATRQPLRTVKPGEVVKPVKPKSVSEAADSGTTRELLVAMRARIAEAVEDKNTPARELASLTKRLMEVVRDIEALDAREAQEATKRADATDQPFDASAV